MACMTIKEEGRLECQACAGEVTHSTTSNELVEIFKELTCIDPISDKNVIVFCNKCQVSLRSFQLFKKLCVKTQEMFVNRQLNSDQEMFEENIEEKSVECEIEIKEKVSETLPEYFVCDLCQTCHRTKRGITAHMKKFHFESRKEPEKLYECDICHSKLACKKNLKAHQLTHNNEKNFKCSHCDAAFKTQTNLHSHEKYVHKLGGKYICFHCAYICYNPTSLNQHIKRHHSTTKFQCDQCSKEFKTIGDLKDHKKIHDNLKKIVPCPECGAMFKFKKSMQSHFRTVHVAVRKFICETCSMGFISNNRLKRHKVIHTGERNFLCTICGQAFTQNQALKRHQTTHTGIRPFSCPYCKHTFAEHFYMKKHASKCSTIRNEASVRKCSTYNASKCVKNSLEANKLAKSNKFIANW